VNDLLGISPETLACPLTVAAVVALTLLALAAWRTPHLWRIGLRNVPRRWLRTVLIVFGLMLATMFVAAALAVDDTITQAVKTVAVFNLGRIDEQVVGGNGPLGQSLGLYTSEESRDVRRALAGDPRVSGIAPALVVPGILVADETARQVRGGVTAMALDTAAAGPLGDLRDQRGAAVSAGALRPGTADLNAATARLLNAGPGDTIYLYSALLPGKRYAFRVDAIVTGGPLGDSPSLLVSLPVLQRIVGAPDQINRIYVANAGDGLTGIGYSYAISGEIDRAVGASGLYSQNVKRDGVQFSLQAQEIFGRILAIFTLFALAIGLLLIFLIFVLLAAERRSELGMARAIGMRRGHVVRMLLFEGSLYDAVAAVLGMAAGFGLGLAIVGLIGPTLQQLGFPLSLTLSPASVAFALCLGFVFTLATIALAAWSVSRMTVSAALRDLPEPPAPQPSAARLVRNALAVTVHIARAPGAMLAAWWPLATVTFTSGLVPLVVGAALLRSAIPSLDQLAFSLGFSCALVGSVLLVRWVLLAAVAGMAVRVMPSIALAITARARRVADRATALLVGGGLALYWSLPFDAASLVGFPRFSGGIGVIFVAGVMMVFGAVWALAPNLDLVLAPLRWLIGRVGMLAHVVRVALVYPAQQRFRTGIGLTLFSLVCFTMVVMACIAASTTASYDNLPQLAAGYDIAGQPLFSPVASVTGVMRSLRASDPAAANGIAAASSATPLPLALLQPSAPQAAWRFYPVSQVDGSFLDGVGLPLVARAAGFESDVSVWQAVRTYPGDVVIDIGALSRQDAATLGVAPPPAVSLQQFLGPPIASGLPGLSSLEAEAVGASDSEMPCGQTASLAQLSTACGALPELASIAGNPFRLRDYTLRLQGVTQAPGTMRATTLWATDLRGGGVTKLTVIGLVDSLAGKRVGLFGSPATFAPIERALPPFGNEFYYFAARPHTDVHATSLALGSALLDHGFETTDLQEVLLNVNGPRVFISRIIVGLVGLTLLVGMAALAVTGSRAVVERRQQIGMLRALGFKRLHVQAIFLIESLLVGVVGTAIGLVLGLLLCRNIFAVDFFERYQTGLALVVPWHELAAICGAALLAAALAAALPAWQAGRVAPADALRYE
jgi:putative ABC transport system permease protein